MLIRMPASSAQSPLKIDVAPSVSVDELRRRARACSGTGDDEGAANNWRQVLSARYDDAEAAHGLGLALERLGRITEALDAFRRACEHAPGSQGFMLSLGGALFKQGRHAEASTVFGDVLALSGTNLEALLGRGRSLKALGRHDEALNAFDRALSAQPDNVEGLFEKGVLLLDMKRGDAAEEPFRRILRAQPDHKGAALGLGKILHEVRRYREAVEILRKTVVSHPDDFGAWLDLGAAALGSREYPISVDAYRMALQINPASPVAYCNMSLALFGLGRMEEGIEACRATLAIEPASAAAHFNMACMYLALGRYEEGWEAYEFRFAMGNTKGIREDVRAAPWRGQNLRGKSLLVIGEQASGDYLHFSRYLSALVEMGADVTFTCPRRLVRLLRTLPRAITLLPEVAAGSRFDFQCQMMSLPLRFCRLGLPIPTVPYLRAEPERVETWRDRIGVEGFKVAVAWHGGVYDGQESVRAFRLEHLRPLTKIPGVRLISLQMKDGVEQLRQCADLPIVVPGEDFDAGEDGFLDTAAVIEAADLVISCDTSIAHLAGAMGKRIWVALNESAEWRWRREGQDTVWYPSMRLFRQPVQDDWDSVFRDITEALREAVGQRAMPEQPPRATEAAVPRVQVSWGECIDKATILAIKASRMSCPKALANVERELAELRRVLAGLEPMSEELTRKQAELRAVNERLWKIEDDIRELEAGRQFDQRFVELARSVYLTNDQRSRIKNEINSLTRSPIVEEKQYAGYGNPARSAAE